MSSPPQICTYFYFHLDESRLFHSTKSNYFKRKTQYMRMNAIELERQRRLRAEKSGSHNEHADESAGGH